MVDRKMKKERKPRRHIDWVKMRADECVCLRCGETHKIVLPMEISIFVKTTRAFVTCHSYCVDRPSANTAVVDPPAAADTIRLTVDGSNLLALNTESK